MDVDENEVLAHRPAHMREGRSFVLAAHMRMEPVPC